MLKTIGISLTLFTSLTLISAVYLEDISRSSLRIDAPIINDYSHLTSKSMAKHDANTEKNICETYKDSTKTE